MTAQARAAAVASGLDVSSVDGGTLHIYTWSDYIAPTVIESFERALNVNVVVDTFDSNESMYAKLKAGACGFDLIMPSSYQITTMVKEGMIVPIDHAKCPNVRKNFDSSFTPAMLDPTLSYNVPYSVSITGFIYDRNKIPQGIELDSWAVLENPVFKGRVSLVDDMREVIGAALMYLGYSINSSNPEEIDAATEQVLKWRGNVRKFDSESYKIDVPGGSTWIGQGFSPDWVQVYVGDEDVDVAPRTDIGFTLPKEGYSVACDEMVIAKDASRPDLAYAFINYIYDGEVAAENMGYIGSPNLVRPGIELLDEDFRKLIVLPADASTRGQVIRSFDDRPEVLELYNRAWDKIRSAETH